jgi:hypothetical protein
MFPDSARKSIILIEAENRLTIKEGIVPVPSLDPFLRSG